MGTIHEHRRDTLDSLGETPPEVIVVGGGITGAGVALDLALRGVAVLLVEKGDWGSSTSSASSRLVHGGLRYLENYELGLVRESCLERALLLRNAAGLVWPEQFAFPIRRGDRVGRWKMAAGLWLYTALSIPRALGLPKMLSAQRLAGRIPSVARDALLGAGSYLDGATDDARLTLAVVQSARRAGARCLSRIEARSIENGTSGVSVQLDDLEGPNTHEVHARAGVLAAGPFTDGLRGRAGLDPSWIQATRGTHILVPRNRLPTDGAVIFPSHLDGRILFLIPWPRYTVIGTTDIDADPDHEVRATGAEVRYLLETANGLCPDAGLGPDDVVSTYAGLRPLIRAPEDNPSARSRGERIEREQSLYTIAGGKLTTWRGMAEGLCARLTADLGIGAQGAKSPTRNHRLHSALDDPVPRPQWSSPPSGSVEADSVLSTAWRRRYASLGPEVTAWCRGQEAGWEPLDPETRLGEVSWATNHEDALDAADFLFRRTDLALGPRDLAEAALDRVVDRMGSSLGWTTERGETSHSAALEEIARAHAWKSDPS